VVARSRLSIWFDSLHCRIHQVVAIVGVLVVVMEKDDILTSTDGAGMKHFAVKGREAGKAV